MLITFQTILDIVKQPIKKVVHVGAYKADELPIYSDAGVEEVLWFEANDDYTSEIMANFKLYPDMKNKLVSVGLDEFRRVVNLKITTNGQSSSLLELGKHLNYYPDIIVVETRSVKVFSYKELAEEFSYPEFDMINVDVQGNELNVLKGFGNHLRKPNLKVIYLEVNREELYKGCPMVEEIDEYLLTYGFKRRHTVWTNCGWGDANYIKC
jgi:FkbM family methyltransferase